MKRPMSNFGSQAMRGLSGMALLTWVSVLVPFVLTVVSDKSAPSFSFSCLVVGMRLLLLVVSFFLLFLWVFLL